MIPITHGVNSSRFDVAGQTVGEVRANLATLYHIRDDAVALVTGEAVGEGYLLLDGEGLDFVVPLGRKGMGRDLTDQELASLLDQIVASLTRIEEKIGRVVAGQTTTPEYLTVRGAARLAAVSQSHVRRAIYSGELLASNVSTAARPVWRIARKDVDAWLEKKRSGTSRVPPRSDLDELVHRHLPGLRGRNDSATR